MLKRWKVSWLDITLVILILAGAAVVFSTSAANANLVQEKSRLDGRLKAAELKLGQSEKETTLENLRQNLEQTRATLAAKLMPGEAETITANNQILQYAETYGITIIKWNSSYISAKLKEKEYPAVSHSLTIRGSTSSLISFMEALTQAPVVPVVKKVDIAEVLGERELWEVRLELVIYYR